jgi:triphosphatase
MADTAGAILTFPGPTPPAPREIEIKFQVDEAQRQPLAAFLKGLGGSARTITQRSTYYDTDDQALRRAGFTLRIRDEGGSRMQTIKRDQGLLFERGEWEVPARADGPDLDAARRTPLKSVVKGAGPLRAQFANRIERRRRTITYEGARIEIALDEGEVEGHGRRTVLSQLELELKAGPPAALFALARTLTAQVPLRLTFDTKAGAGYALAWAEAPRAIKGVDADLAANMTAGEAFAAVAASCLRQIVANEVVLRLHRRPDALHQMRVGLRRLRSAMTLFSSAAGDGRHAFIKAELKWLTQQLDEARDIDVFIAESYRPAVETLGRDHGLAEFGKRLGRARTRAYDRTLKALSSPRAIALPLALAEWLESGDWRARPEIAETRDRPASDFAADSLARLRRKLKRKGRDLSALSAEARHEARIAGKKLRYGVAFFAPLLPAKATGRFIDRLKALQADLGALNDLAVGRQTAADLSRGAHAADLSFAAGLVVGLRSVGEEKLLGRAEAHYKALLDAKPPWRGI